MRLRELEAEFLRYNSGHRSDPNIAPPGGKMGDERDAIWYTPVATLEEAHGINFLCPKCFAANGGPAGTHSVICWFFGKVPADAEPAPGRWCPAGSGFDDLTFVSCGRGGGPEAVSVALQGGCGWHGFVNNGDAT